MSNMQQKLENPLRLAELDPPETLKKIGLMAHHTVCDIGAGSGIFTLPAAKITKNKVYALEINEEMLSVIGEKAKASKVDHIELILVKDTILPMADQTIDLVLMVTVLHEIDDKISLLLQIKRILKKHGMLAIIEFHKQKTPLGPSPDHRISQMETENLLQNAGYDKINQFSLGDNFYCVVFKPTH